MEELWEEQTLAKEPKEVNMLGRHRLISFVFQIAGRRGILVDKDGKVDEYYQVVPYEMDNILPF